MLINPANMFTAEWGSAFQDYVRSKAIKAGSNLVYMEDDQIIKENPRTGEKTVIKQSPLKDH